MLRSLCDAESWHGTLVPGSNTGCRRSLFLTSCCLPLQTDQCGRLWVIDSGTVNVFSGAERLCPPKLVVFDLRGRDGAELVAKYTFPSAQREPTTLAITVAVDVRGTDPGSCRDAFAYVADVTEPAILVYDMRRNRWVLELQRRPRVEVGCLSSVLREPRIQVGCLPVIRKAAQQGWWTTRHSASGTSRKRVQYGI